MADEKKLEEIIAEPTPAATTEDKKLEQKANLDKAIEEAQKTLRETRAKIKEAKVVDDEEDGLPQIDMEDPSAKAWDKHIKRSNAPFSQQLEKQKEEVRTFALRKYLADKPSLAKNPEKLKELMSNYDLVKTSTEQTQEGVLMDLDKAYGATFHEELMTAARNTRIDRARDDMIYADIAVDKGSTNEPNTPAMKRRLSAEEQRIVDSWSANGAPQID